MNDEEYMAECLANNSNLIQEDDRLKFKTAIIESMESGCHWAEHLQKDWGIILAGAIENMILDAKTHGMMLNNL